MCSRGICPREFCAGCAERRKMDLAEMYEAFMQKKKKVKERELVIRDGEIIVEVDTDDDEG